MNRKPWPRPLGALAGAIFLVLFVTVPDLRHAGWDFAVLRYLTVPMVVAGIVGAIVGWLLVVLRNKVAA